MEGRVFLSVTIELDSLAPPGLRQTPRPAADLRPWTRADEHWARLAPRGRYAEHIRGPLLLALTLPLVPLALLVSLPIVLVNLCVQRSPRRVFFAQPRVGWRGEIFVLYKFRTMRDRPGDDHARVTGFGRFLRNTHLDELPQLFNVLRGEMCLIGPRPEMVATERWAARRFPGFSERLVLKPGLTGYAQITQGYTDGGDEAAYAQKLALNREYRERLTVETDLAILGRTILWMLRGRGWRRPG